MDRNYIDRSGADLRCYRIRTARQKKRMLYEDLDKRLINLHREEKELIRRERNLGWIALEPPVQKGWRRFFVLREDVATGKSSAFFENILKKINTFDWSYRKDFKVRRRRYGRKAYVVKGQKLLQPDERHFAKLAFTENERQFFHLEYKYVNWAKESVPIYVFNEPWRFVLRVRPNVIDKQRARDPELEAKLKKIDSYLERNDYRHRQMKLIYGRNINSYAIGVREKELNPLRNKPLHRILNELEEESL